MSANKKSVAAQALLEMDSIVSALKEESKKTLGSMLNEAVKDALREGVEEDDDEKDYEVVDDEKDAEDGDSDSNSESADDVDEQGDENVDAIPQDGAQGAAAAQDATPAGAEMGAQEAPAAGAEEVPAEGEGEEDGWDDFSQYEVGDDTYDLTGEKDYDNVIKVYKLLKDDDHVVVKKEGDSVELKDNETGAEYLIDLGGDDEPAEDADVEAGAEGEDVQAAKLNEGEDGIAGLPDDEFADDEFDLGSEFDGEGEDGFDLDGEDDFNFDDEDGLDGEDEFSDTFASDELDGGIDNNEMFENKKTRKPMKESKEVLFEVDLGYTDNYQDKDPIKGLSNNEPSKSGKSWHKGVPTGTQKPWAGSSKDKSEPFGEKTVDEEAEKCCPKCGKCGKECTCEKEVDEQTNVGGFVQQNSVTTTHTSNSNGRKARSQRTASQGAEVTGSADPRYKAAANESKELKAIKAENRELKKAVVELRKNLNEAYITNVNLGKITKLFLENTTSRAEKIDIVNRFSNEAKTVEQSKALYESIDRELKKTNKKDLNLNETSRTANGTKELNENKAAYKSQDVLKTIDFMNRVLNC